MRHASGTFGPPQATYSREAVYIAIASIYDDLSLEHGQWRSLADHIRKRCEAREALDWPRIPAGSFLYPASVPQSIGK
jgi:hypothetical protein